MKSFTMVNHVKYSLNNIELYIQQELKEERNN